MSKNDPERTVGMGNVCTRISSMYNGMFRGDEGVISAGGPGMRVI